MINIIPIRYCYNRCYLVNEEDSWMIVDTGFKGSSKQIFKAFLRAGIVPEEISLIILTHVHHDHVGNAALLHQVCKAPILVHSAEALTLERGEAHIPEGTSFLTRMTAFLGRTSLNRFLSYAPVKAHILVDETVLLKDFGFSAVVVPTPGHTKGSLSVLFGSGETLIGDTCINLPWKNTVFPSYVNEKHVLLRSWKTLLESEASIFYPGHGEAFTKDLLTYSYDTMMSAWA